MSSSLTTFLSLRQKRNAISVRHLKSEFVSRNLFTLFTVLTLAVRAQTNFLPVLKVGDEVYKNVTIVTNTPSDVLISHDEGAVRIAFTNLPVFIQKQYGFDAEKATAYESDKASAAKVKKEAEFKRLSTHAAETDFFNQIETTYDKFNGITSFTTRHRIAFGTSLEVQAYGISGDSIGFTGSVTVHFTSQTRSWSFLDYHKFIILYDGKKKDFGEVDHDGTVGDGYVLEQMTAQFTLAEFKEVAFAKEVSGRLGIQELAFGYDARKEWRTLATHLAQLEK